MSEDKPVALAGPLGLKEDSATEPGELRPPAASR